MTEAVTGEPTPRDHNLRLRAIYDQITPPSASLEMDPSIIYALEVLFKKAAEGRKRGKPMTRRISESDLYTTESKEAVKKERHERMQSPELDRLSNELRELLYVHSGLTPGAVEVAMIQFITDYAGGRRVEDPIRNATTVRFSQYLLLDMGNPDGEGIFSTDREKVREIEREIWGAYLDWVEIGFAFDEEDLLLQWKADFKERYGDVPYPNLEPKPKKEWFPKSEDIPRGV
ncbi:MAG: hypothetical protein HYV38_01945 [Candidatus Levybacteria bacterium]|nr:hypothetical protein [Candidatus Levybacteria bacterium]